MPKDNLIERLRELLAKATKRPWFSSRYRGASGSQVWAGEPGPTTAVLICGEGDAEDVDADLIVETVNALPDLLDEIARLKGENERLHTLAKANNQLARMNGAHRDEWRAKAVSAQALIEEMVEGLKRIAYRRPAGNCKNPIIIDIENEARTLITKATEPDRATLTQAPSLPPDESPRPGC